MSRGGYRGGVRVADKVDRVYAVIARAARLGEAAPKNEDFATAVGSSTVGGIPAYLRMLQAQGRVVIDGEQGRKARRFYVPAIEMWTAWSNRRADSPPKAPRPKRAAEAPAVRQAAPPPPPPPPVKLPTCRAINGVGRRHGHMGSVRRLSVTVVPDLRFATCQFIAGAGRERGFCGEPVKPGSPYCPEHHARCYRPAPKDGAGEPGFAGTVPHTEGGQS